MCFYFIFDKYYNRFAQNYLRKHLQDMKSDPPIYPDTEEKQRSFLIMDMSNRSTKALPNAVSHSPPGRLSAQTSRKIQSIAKGLWNTRVKRFIFTPAEVIHKRNERFEL